MSPTLKAALDELITEISRIEIELQPRKTAANALAATLGLPEPFSNSGGGQYIPPKPRSLTWKPDQFFNRPLAGSAQEVLEARKSFGLDGPASTEEIYEALKAGGFKFGGSGSDDNSKRALKIALTKNTTYFAKINEDTFGLRKWYGGKPQRKSVSNKSDDASTEETEGAEDLPEVEPEDLGDSQQKEEELI